ncbi:MAG: ABC transporter permease [Lachnospiraceae bacterium]|nr:ABC transporter permease [Lachnospiraceae bacterium]
MKRRPSITDKLIPLAALLILILVWELICLLGIVPGYMLPSPVRVGAAFISEFPLMMSHAWVTLCETAAGLFLGIILGFITAAVMDTFGTVKRALYPILVLSQTIPTVALAPLLILWFSYGMAPKVILIVLTSFFPIAVGLMDGFAGIDPDQINLMRAMKAGKLQIFIHLKFPGALPEFFSGLKIAVSYSVVSAVVSEWLGGTSGLGVYMIRVKKSYSYDKMFAVIILVSAVSLMLIALLNIISRKAMPWKHCGSYNGGEGESK